MFWEVMNLCEFRKIDPGNLVPGMRVAREVENQFGAILLSPGMILDNNLIKKLQRLGVAEIEIINESEEELAKNKDKFTEQYWNSIGNVKEMLFNAKKN